MRKCSVLFTHSVCQTMDTSHPQRPPHRWRSGSNITNFPTFEMSGGENNDLATCWCTENHFVHKVQSDSLNFVVCVRFMCDCRTVFSSRCVVRHIFKQIFLKLHNVFVPFLYCKVFSRWKPNSIPAVLVVIDIDADPQTLHKKLLFCNIINIIISLVPREMSKQAAHTSAQFM